MGYDEARTALSDLYEHEFGIMNHAAIDKNPLCSVLFHEEENVLINSGLRDLIEDFAIYDLGSLWNISLDDYLKLPRPYYEIMTKIRDRVITRKQKELQAAGRDLFK